jgi:hypothetical protein
MKQQLPAASRQSGVALILFLVALIMAAGYAFYRSSNVGALRIQQDAKLAATLARAKEALIAYAVTRNDDPGPSLKPGRPGSLPCPDLITNNAGFSNFPGDGKTDFFTVNSCPSYIGWLPWVTLDLPELTDDTGTRLWYVLTPELRNHDSAQPINSDRALTLKLDGAADSVAALVIAARAPLDSQARPSNNPADYLDGENGNGDDNIYVSGPPSASFNDMVVAITRQELMAAVEKRVANELKTCLEQHAAATTNTAHTYPWPTPFASTAFRGTAGSLFGQVPATEPGAGAESLLQQANNALSTAKNALSSALTATDQMTALLAVSNAATYAQTLYDKIYGVASATATVATTNNAAFTQLDLDIANATANGRISRTERTALRAEALADRDSLTALQTALTDSGIDPFPNEVKTQDLVLQQTISAANNTPTTTNFTALQTQANVLVKLFSLSTTPNPDIAAALSNAKNAASATVVAASNAVLQPADTALQTAAITTAQALVTANSGVRSIIVASRVNLHYSEISTLTDQLSTLLTAFNSNPGTATASALATGISDLQSTTTTLSTASSLVVASRTTTLNALATALSAAQGANDYPLIQATSNAVITAANNLASAIANNGDNVLKESLAVAATAYISAQETFATVTPRTQAAMIPYVQAVQAPAVNIEYWSKITARVANDIASQARKTPNTTSDNSNSAYATADQLTTGISGSSGTQALLQAYIDTPTSSSKQAAATAALNTTAGQLDTLLTSAGTLDSILDSSGAEAFPTVWYGTACAFLQPANGSTSWWTANNWANTTFYQISDRVRATTGKLQVNGSGTYRVVVLSAGRALLGSVPPPPNPQNRATRTTANFLEGINADTSRDGNAKTPVTGFANSPLSTTFNDRLGY